MSSSSRKEWVLQRQQRQEEEGSSGTRKSTTTTTRTRNRLLSFTGNRRNNIKTTMMKLAFLACIPLLVSIQFVSYRQKFRQLFATTISFEEDTFQNLPTFFSNYTSDFLQEEEVESSSDEPVPPNYSYVEESNNLVEKSKFLVLRNVCLSRRRDHHGGDSGDLMRFFSPTSTGGAKTQSLVQQHITTYKTYYRPYTAWDTDIMATPLLAPPLERVHAILMTNTTLEAWFQQKEEIQQRNNNNNTRSSGRKLGHGPLYLNGTTVVAEPHHPDNNFHLYNDLIIGVLYKVIKSGSRPPPPPPSSQLGQGQGRDRRKHRNNKKKKQHMRPLRLLLTHGNREYYERRVIGFDVLERIFDEVRYALEGYLTHHTSICFERLIWGGKLEPYYHEVGRFGLNNTWEGILPEIRDWINEIYGIQVPPVPPVPPLPPPLQSMEKEVAGEKVTELNNNNNNHPTTTNSTTQAPSQAPPQAQAHRKPTITWIDRPCPQKRGNIDERCFHNRDNFLYNHLAKKGFDIQILSFNRLASNYTQELQNMLQLLAKTDILMGIHGAGLAHIVYLQSHAIVVEILPKGYREKKLFLNMASKQNIGYYRYDPGKERSATSRGVDLTDAQKIQFTNDLWNVWNQEMEYYQQQEQEKENQRRLLLEQQRQQQDEAQASANNTLPLHSTEAAAGAAANAIDVATQQCSFPIRNPRGMGLSSFELSRCYLEQDERNRGGSGQICKAIEKLSSYERSQCSVEQERSQANEWFQCSTYWDCNPPLGSHLVW